MTTPTTDPGVALAATYYFRVESDGLRGFRTRYDGADAADAMAAWSKAISLGAEYVTLEALRDRPVVTAKTTPGTERIAAEDRKEAGQ